MDAEDLISMFKEQAKEVSSRTTVKRVKIPVGHIWLVRFLPVQLGPNKTPFAKIARHWVNKRPLDCPRETHPDFGGDAGAECPMCDIADKLNGSTNRELSLLGFRNRGNPTFLTYCLVLEREDESGDVETPSSKEIWHPWEFWLSGPVFQDLSTVFRKEMSRYNRNIFDLKKGRPFTAKSKKTGLRLQQQDPEPVCNLKDLEKIEGLVMSRVKFTQPSFSLDDLEEAAEKLEELADDVRHGPKRSRRSDEDEDEPRSRRRAKDDEDEDEPRSRRRAEVDNEDEDDDEPRSRRRAGEDEPRSRRRAKDGEDEDEPRSRKRAETDDEDDSRRRRRVEEDEGEDEPRKRRQDEGEDETQERPSRKKESREEDDLDMSPPPPSTRAKLDPPPARRVEDPVPARRSSAKVAEDADDEPPEEIKDPAPAKPLEEEDLPPTTGGKQQGLSRLSERIRRSIRATEH